MRYDLERLQVQHEARTPKAIPAGRLMWCRTPRSNSTLIEFRMWSRLSPREQANTRKAMGK
jgi:hypothetical protein